LPQEVKEKKTAEARTLKERANINPEVRARFRQAVTVRQFFSEIREGPSWWLRTRPSKATTAPLVGSAKSAWRVARAEGGDLER